MPEAMVGQPRLDYLWHFDLDITPELLWTVLSDTSRMNRAVKVSEMAFTPQAGQLRGSARPGGFLHEWIEVPWNWVAGQWMESVRLYERGFMRALFTVFHLEPHAGGTRLYTYFGFVPRGWWGALAIRIGFPSLQGEYRRVLPAVVADLKEGRAALQVASASLEPGAESRIAAIRQKLYDEGLDRGAVDRLVGWIKSGDDEDLHRIQILERARAWDVDELVLLKVALHGTRAGLLELSWDVVCPHCRGVTGARGKLAEVEARGACAMCNLEFGTTDAVEITFHVHPSIRDIPRRMYCSAEPKTKQHIRFQVALPSGKHAELMPSLPPGRYRLRLDGEQKYGLVDVRDDIERATFEWRAAEQPPSDVALAPAPTVVLRNDTDAARTFIVERSQWVDSALRPGRLLSLQDFRDLYAEEFVGNDIQLDVGEQTILFTDIVGSTAMYARRGDPAAYVEVRRQFDELFPIVAKHHGAVVKTIGDALMAAFRDPVDAVKAAAAMQRAFPPTRTDTETRIRISLHTGPCIAVRLNADIDFFGNTVNLAAKLQAMAEAWQIAMSEATYGAPGVADWLAAEKAPIEALTYSNKAYADPIAVRRWTLFEVTG